MSKKALLDTNILLDAAMSERPDWRYAVLLFDEIAYGSLDGCISATSLKDVYYILSKYIDEHAAREYVDAALDLFDIVPVDYTVCRMAVRSDEPDFGDGLVRACAVQEEVDFIISRDEKAFVRCPIRRMSAREYVEVFCNVEEVDI